MKMIDLDIVIEKLRRAGLVKEYEKGYKGVFSVKNHGHFLEPKELEVWLFALHKGSKHDDQTCSDLHSWDL